MIADLARLERVYMPRHGLIRVSNFDKDSSDTFRLDTYWLFFSSALSTSISKAAPGSSSPQTALAAGPPASASL